MVVNKDINNRKASSEGDYISNKNLLKEYKLIFKRFISLLKIGLIIGLYTKNSNFYYYSFSSKLYN